MLIEKVRLYTDLKYRAANEHRSMMPVVSAQLDQTSPEERIKKHHARATHFELVSEIDQSDWCVLPDVWPAYVSKRKVYLARKFADVAAKNGKFVLAWSGGDPEWIIPIENAIQVQEGLYRGHSRQVAFAFERPGFIEDHIQIYQNSIWKPAPRNSVPTIGFCGQAASRWLSRIHFYLQNFLTTIKYRFGMSAVVPTLGGYSVDLRLKTLRLLKEAKCVQTNFIVRDRYKAGVSSGVQLSNERSRLEFVGNILDNVYTVCARGGGNFSKRFYETLCCGRIPVLIDTDTVLPFEEFVEWDKYILRVKRTDLDKIGDIICDFHSGLSVGELEERQRQCRQLWKEYLSPIGYYSHFHRYLSITNPKINPRKI